MGMELNKKLSFQVEVYCSSIGRNIVTRRADFRFLLCISEFMSILCLYLFEVACLCYLPSQTCACREWWCFAPRTQ